MPLTPVNQVVGTPAWSGHRPDPCRTTPGPSTLPELLEQQSQPYRLRGQGDGDRVLPPCLPHTGTSSPQPPPRQLGVEQGG